MLKKVWLRKKIRSKKFGVKRVLVRQQKMTIWRKVEYAIGDGEGVRVNPGKEGVGLTEGRKGSE